ncbi:MAG: hypothetical protein HYU99_05460 [Deltaproteobacteria bacterium]|nr:hypothetical protein [Deltaproteobacteria bacterium]
MKISLQRLSLSFWFLAIVSCGGIESSDNTNNAESDEITPSEAGTPAILIYFFETQLDSDDDLFDFAFPYPDSYSVPLYVQGDGTVTLFARDFPAMILRICETDDDDCDVTYEGLGIGEVDLVLDSCGRDLEDDECGEVDDSAFTGTLSADGSLTIGGIYIRARIFAVSGASDGFTADPGDTGLLPDLERLVVRVTTGSVATGDLAETGSSINDGAIKLVAAGLIPDSMPTIGGVHYISSLTGTFDIDPLGLLE